MKTLFTSAILTILFQTFSFAQPTEENLVLHLPFNNNLEDASGNDHIATKHGTTFVEDRNGKPNSAIYFDGIDDHIDIEHRSTLNFGLGDFTISFWLKYPSQLGGHSPETQDRAFDYATVFIKTAKSHYPYEGITFFVDSPRHGDIKFRTSAYHELNSKTNYNNNEWHYYVLIRSGKTLLTYIDGELVGSIDQPIDNLDNNAAIRLGANHVDYRSQNLEGVLDDLKIYDNSIDLEKISPDLFKDYK